MIDSTVSFVAMVSKLVPQLFLLLAITTAPSLVNAFLLPFSDALNSSGVMKMTNFFKSMENTEQTKNAFPIATSRSSSSLTAWRLPFGAANKLPKVGEDGMYHIASEEEYRALVDANHDKLIVLKIYSTWCKTCKAMAPKFEALARGIGTNHRGGSTLPIVWATLTYCEETNRFVRGTLGVKAVPSVQLYAGNGVLVDSFPCGPTKVSKILLPKLIDLIAKHVDVSTGTLKIVPANATAANDTTTNISKLHP